MFDKKVFFHLFSFKINYLYTTIRPSARSVTLRGQTFIKKGSFKAVWSNLIQKKIQVIIQDKVTYYKIKGFFNINHRRPIVPFINFNNFNSDILIIYLSFLIYTYVCNIYYITVNCKMFLIKTRCRNVKQKWNSFFLFD